MPVGIGFGFDTVAPTLAALILPPNHPTQFVPATIDGVDSLSGAYEVAFTVNASPPAANSPRWRTLPAESAPGMYQTTYVDQGRVFTGQAGGSWVKQIDKGASGSLGLVYARPPGGAMIYRSGTSLMKKVYLANGTGAESTIVDFATRLDWTFEVAESLPHAATPAEPAANTLLLSTPGAIYQFTDGGIP